MKIFVRSAFFLLLAGSAMVFAGGGLSDPTGSASIQVDKTAGGKRLDGVIVVELYTDPFLGESSGRVILRLKMDNKVATFYTELPAGTDTSAPVVVQSIVTEQLKQQILNTFFANDKNFSSLQIKLKSVANASGLGLPPDPAIATTLTCSTPIAPADLPNIDTLDPDQCPTAGSNILVMDVELRVK